MNILFVNANLHGHINPTLGLVKTHGERTSGQLFLFGTIFGTGNKDGGKMDWIQ